MEDGKTVEEVVRQSNDISVENNKELLKETNSSNFGEQISSNSVLTTMPDKNQAPLSISETGGKYRCKACSKLFNKRYNRRRHFVFEALKTLLISNEPMQSAFFCCTFY
jgi:hypothetical protein